MSQVKRIFPMSPSFLKIEERPLCSMCCKRHYEVTTCKEHARFCKMTKFKMIDPSEYRSKA